MEFHEHVNMVAIEKGQSTQCVVYDHTPGSDQKKINIVVRPSYTVGKVISDVITQYPYEHFDLLLQPATSNAQLVHLNECKATHIYDVPGFEPMLRNSLILLPPGVWDGNVTKRFDVPVMQPPKYLTESVNNGTLHNNHSNCSNTNFANKNVDNVLQSQQVSQSSIDMSYNNDSINNGGMVNVVSSTVADTFNVSPMSDHEQISDDDLALGASASPTETEPMNGAGPLSLAHTSPSSTGNLKFGTANEEEGFPEISAKSSRERTEQKYPASSPRSATGGFVGLVNQAMTCYLNSLLQALFMTPEFRNALYRWEFDNDNEAKNIPYQLQKLFVNLQTSKKTAVETTDLTRSFGWDSSEAWQQHDIQELCRVMFDALEHKFRHTKQANLIANLYEGKMLDYVKCLECETEKTRADTFLDIPLPVRPFGSTIAYGSIEEALRAFVQPETLDGNNQYFCEKCNKKCDAHKGLKFDNFPYILTLHLKRFDFDYQTMHRIKLNDKVTFPPTLNLNSFISSPDGQNTANPSNGTMGGNSNGYVLNNGTGLTTNDDCSTTDSGSAMEEDNCSSGLVTTASSSQHENEMNDEDEGIDMSTSTDHRITESTTAEQRLQHEAGPYIYELFAIMIHSGSASGGHYYAYIKDFDNNEWFCFNDQSVSPITQEDIQKTFGGANANKTYYSSVYSSSTNAYMLMYRQIDPKRNERVIKQPDFPQHIQSLLGNMSKEDDRGPSTSRVNAVTDLALPDLIKPRVYFYNPVLKKLKVTRIYVSRSFNIHSVLESAYNLLGVDRFAPLSRCRLVGFDQSFEEILQSFENVADPALTEIRESCEGTMDFLLEYCAEGQEFDIYHPGGRTWDVFTVNLAKVEIDGPFLVHSPLSVQNDTLRRSIARRLHVKESHLLLVTLASKKAFVAYDPAPTKESQDHLQALVNTSFRKLKYFYLNVPNTEPSALELLGIPPYEPQPPTIEVSCDVVDAVLMNGATAHQPMIGEAVPMTSKCSLGATSTEQMGRESRHESNSEDSSLSDGDRTLVESLHNRGGGDSQISSSSHSPQLSSPENEPSADPYSRIHAYFNGFMENGDGDASGNQDANLYFFAMKVEAVDNSTVYNTQNASYQTTTSESSEDAANRPVCAYKVIVDARMKMSELKQRMEPLVRVPCNYFKIQRKMDSISPSQSLTFLSDGETLMCELGRVLQPDEYKAKISYMRLSDLNDEIGKLTTAFEWIYSVSTTVAEAKKELAAKFKNLDPKYHTLTPDNMRIWLKGGRNPIRILHNDETLLNDARSSVAAEYLVQECEDGVAPEPHPDSLTIFVRRWHADKLVLDKFQEITLDKDSEIRSSLAKITDICEEHIAYSRINGSFPCTNISHLNINSSMSWFSIPATLDKYPLTTTVNGNVYFYKDVTKAPKDLTSEERRELAAKEKIRLDRLGCTSTGLYTTRRERALKIYLDSPQSNSGDAAPQLVGEGDDTGKGTN